MLPGNRCVYRWMMVVSTPDPEGGEHAAAAAAREVGRGRPGRAGAALPDHPRRRDPHPLPDGPAERPGPCRRPDRPAGPPQPRHRPARAQALPGPRSGRGPAPAPSRAATPLPARLGTGTGPGGRPGPHEVGVDSALWTCQLLADYLAEQTGHRAGIETVRIALHRAGFVCKRPRWVLSRKAQAQPGWAKNA